MGREGAPAAVQYLRAEEKKRQIEKLRCSSTQVGRKTGIRSVQETRRGHFKKRMLAIAKSSSKIQTEALSGVSNTELVDSLDKSSVSAETGTESIEIHRGGIGVCERGESGEGEALENAGAGTQITSRGFDIRSFIRSSGRDTEFGTVQIGW